MVMNVKMPRVLKMFIIKVLEAVKNGKKKKDIAEKFGIKNFNTYLHAF